MQLFLDHLHLFNKCCQAGKKEGIYNPRLGIKILQEQDKTCCPIPTTVKTSLENALSVHKTLSKVYDLSFISSWETVYLV